MEVLLWVLLGRGGEGGGVVEHGLQLLETGAVVKAVLIELASPVALGCGESVECALTLSPGVGGVVEGQGQ